MANDETEHGGHGVNAKGTADSRSHAPPQRELLSFHIDIEQHVDNVILRVVRVLCHHLKQITADLLAAAMRSSMVGAR